VLHDSDTEISLTYDTATHEQTIVVQGKRAKLQSRNEFMIYTIEYISHHKNFILTLFKVVKHLRASNMNVEIAHMTFNKAVLIFNGEFLVTFVLRFTSGDLVRVFLSPQVGSLNDFLSYKLSRTLKQHYCQVDIMQKLLSVYLSEVYNSYNAFGTVCEMQYTSDSMRQGPYFENVSIAFEFQ